MGIRRGGWFHRTVCVAFVLFVGSALFSPLGASRIRLQLFEEFNLIREVLRHVDQQYVDEEKVDREKLLYGAVDGIVKKLDDPFSRFMRPEAFDSMQTEASGEFGGLGILISIRDDVLTVIAPMPGTPAYREGIRAGDQIIQVDGRATQGMSVNDAVKILRGPVGTDVTLGVRRDGARALVSYSVTRDVIKVSSVNARMVDEHIGYIHLTGFIQTTGEDLEKAISRFESERDLRGIVLDLRNNPGGLLNAAVEVARTFLGRAQIVSVRSRQGEDVTYSSFTQSHQDVPVVVLINRGSASASEIVAGALRDNRRAVLLGEPTFGKGSVQTVLPLPDGSALALTTAYYYTPSGISIHEKGIRPHVHVELPTLTDDEVRELRADRERDLEREDDPTSIMSISRFDTQLLQAVEVLRSAQVFYDRIVARLGDTAKASTQFSPEASSVPEVR